MSRAIHDPTCARTLDVAKTAGERLSKYKVPACTCRERQKARLRFTTTGGGEGRGTSASEGTPLGGGNYWQPTRAMSDGSDRGRG